MSFIDNNDDIANIENIIHRLPYIDFIFYYLSNQTTYCVQCDNASAELVFVFIIKECSIHCLQKSVLVEYEAAPRFMCVCVLCLYAKLL